MSACSPQFQADLQEMPAACPASIEQAVICPIPKNSISANGSYPPYCCQSFWGWSLQAQRLSGGASVDLGDFAGPSRRSISNHPGAGLVWPRRSRGPVLVDDVLLFLFAGADCRLPCGGLLTWSRSNCLDLLLFGLLGFPVASLLALGHADFSLSF